MPQILNQYHYIICQSFFLSFVMYLKNIVSHILEWLLMTFWNEAYTSFHVFSISHTGCFATIYNDYLLTICARYWQEVFPMGTYFGTISFLVHILILKCISSLLYVALYIVCEMCYRSFHKVLADILSYVSIFYL